MKKSKGIKGCRMGIPIYLLILFSVFISACTGQDKTNVTKDNSAESNTISDDTSIIENEPYVDPLFFIEGQLCQHVRKIFQDKEGNLWFGTNVYGLMRYDGDTLVYFDEKDGLGGGRITGIVEDKEGNVWFGTYRGLTKYDPSAALRPALSVAEGSGGKSFTNYTEKDGLLENEIWSLIIDSKGIFWIGTNDGISRFDPSASGEALLRTGGKKFVDFPIPKAQVKDTTTIYDYDRITSIIEDRNGNLWFGTDGFGICIYDGKTFTLITMENGLPGNTIYDLMEDRNGNIWIGTFFGGVSMFDGKTFTNFTKDSVISGVEAGGFYEDKSGNIWFAAENHGVYRYDPSAALRPALSAAEGSGEKSFANFYTDDGLNTNGILNIYEDKESRFWFGGWGGLFRYDGETFISVTKEGPWE